MRKAASALAVVIALGLAGCNEDDQQTPKQSSLAAAAPAPKKTDVQAAAKASNDAPPRLQDEIEGAADAGSGENDPGRVTFDGDKKRDGARAPAGPVYAGSAGAGARDPNALYTAPGSGNTLTTQEPPPPTSDGKPQVRLAAMKLPASPGDATLGNESAGDRSGARSQGATTGARGAKGCPEGMSYIDGYCIDKYEAALETGGAPWPYNQVPDPAKSYKAVVKRGIMPQGYISGELAAAACAGAGKRLCSIKEWMTACEGSLKTQYPYGAAWQAGYCNEYDHVDHAGHRSAIHRVNDRRKPPLPDSQLFTMGPMNDPAVDAEPESVAPAGSYSRCRSDYDVYDMVGNLHEWTSDRVGARGVFKGGYFEDTHLNGNGCHYATTAHEPRYHDYSIGFRCCSDPS